MQVEGLGSAYPAQSLGISLESVALTALASGDTCWGRVSLPGSSGLPESGVIKGDLFSRSNVI